MLDQVLVVRHHTGVSLLLSKNMKDRVLRIFFYSLISQLLIFANILTCHSFTPPHPPHPPLPPISLNESLRRIYQSPQKHKAKQDQSLFLFLWSKQANLKNIYIYIYTLLLQPNLLEIAKKAIHLLPWGINGQISEKDL